MIHHRTTHPLLPSSARLPRPIVRLATALFRRVLARWRHGSVEVLLPDGEALRAGDPTTGDHAIISVLDPSFFARVLTRGEVGAGESYVAGEWDSPDLVSTLRLFLRNLDHLDLDGPLASLVKLPSLARHQLRRNSRRGSESNIHAHYDLGNDFYRLFLADDWSYSCAIWDEGVTSLEEAQTLKLRRLCESLELAPSDHLLEIGCGWGSFALFAARHVGCRVTGITLSREQLRLARERVAAAGLEGRIELRYCDYRDVDGRFDKIASIEMIEAVGYEFLDDFFAVCAAHLRPGGALAIQSILMPEHKFERYRRSIDWTQLYIFPGSLIPSLETLSRSWSAAGFDFDGAEEIGTSYAPTLAEWRRRFIRELPKVRELGFDRPFERLWNLYLAFSEAAFAERSLGNAQIVLRRRS